VPGEALFCTSQLDGIRGELGSPPKDLSRYLDALARVMFQTGISWRVVDSKWPGIRKAFHGFDVRRVAKFRAADIDRLMGDTRVVRNRKKLEAIRENAREMRALDTEYKGFKRQQLVLPMDGRA
jgi:3-methyladenine DNA glycosylase Tag